MSADGGRQDDGFYTNSVATGEISSPLAHLTPPLAAAPTGASIPPPIMWQPSLLNQQYIHHQPHTQPSSSQQQQQYNELYYNMHAQAYAAPPVQPETYSVLPVGHGNFLKVYHRTEGGPSGGGANDAILYQQQFPQQPQFHLATAPQQTQPIFNSYELFSSSTLMTTPDNSNISSASQTLAAQELPMQQQPLHWTTTPSCNNAELHSPPVSNSTTNMIINKLVNNWSPNLTGGTYSQFSAPLGQVPNVVPTPIQNGCSQQETPFSPQIQPLQPELSASVNLNAHIQDAPILTFNNMNSMVSQTASLQPSYLPQPAQQPLIPTAPTQHPQPSQQQQLSADASLLPTTEMRVLKEPAVSGSVCSNNVCGPLQPAEGSKKRIVAEVKPMRMTYSDVLSKLNNQHSNQTVQSTTTVKSTADRKSKLNTSSGVPPISNERKSDYKRPTESNISGSSTQRPSHFEDATGTVTQSKAIKKSPTHDNKENVQQNIGNAAKPPNNKQRSCAFNNATNNKNSQKASQKAATSDVHPTVSSASQKKRANKKTEPDFVSVNSSARCNNKSSSSNAPDKDYNGFYNVTAKKTENVAKSAQNTSSSSNFRRSAKSTAYSTTASTSSAQTNARNNQRSSNGSSLTYSTKRGRNGNVTAANSNSNSRNYVLARKFLNTWLEYTIKVLNWLFYLVYDIIVLGFSMVYERLTHYYVCGFAFAQQLRKEFRQNSNRPSIWLRNYLRRFDARFKKNSRWALWRLFYKKKQPEASADFYKNGRLPQTGEEAMYSLLNCKGKDAYSILGVPSNSSQEQIRKHYKKIAVLVHPDKNKQAGAEEAFKVLQRAFELIGEPENRESYDRSLDEALHAEKAWTELHDLLSQLQTKITEAANTIRCSTCGLRHPRKLTDRPHYAARECASCKIRHSAREGDIWAETTFLGLRWKYLALMEGKVYNITEWANCQKGALSHLEPNSHMVQYRIVRGAQHQQSQQQKTQAGSFHHPHPQVSGKYSQRGDVPGHIPASEATLHEFLDNLYSGQNPNGQSNPTAFAGSTRKRTRRN